MQRRGVYEISVKKNFENQPIDQRPTSHLGKFQMAISLRGVIRSTSFWFYVRFSGSVNRMALFPVSLNPRWRLGCHLGKFKWRYLRDGSSDLLRVWSRAVRRAGMHGKIRTQPIPGMVWQNSYPTRTRRVQVQGTGTGLFTRSRVPIPVQGMCNSCLPSYSNN